MKAIGIDIGTTTICGIVLDAENGSILDVRTLANEFFLEGKLHEKIQDAEGIWNLVDGMYQEFISTYDDICGIGLTGQMHGIVFVDEKGSAVSPLYTWQDESGNEMTEEGKRYTDELSEKTGYACATGFGISTFYYLTQKNLLPKNARYFCTIPDYIGLQLTGEKVPVTTPSMAASLGCFDLQQLSFDQKKITEAGMDVTLLPQCSNGFVLLGKTKQGIPVAASIGDNQASILGSVKYPEESVLFNIGTGSQVSAGIDHYVKAEGIELRPLVGDSYILVGSGLCGGRAYAALEKFFAMTVEAMTGEKTGKLYDRMSELLKEEEPGKSAGAKLVADTRFCGTREDPSLTGSIQKMTLDNFTPTAMTAAILEGIAEELVTYHRLMREQGASKPKYLIGSGNGIRMNPWLRKVFETIYQMPMQIPVHKEEAAFGAALYAICTCAGEEDLNKICRLIEYEK